MHTVPIFMDSQLVSESGVRLQTSHCVWVSHKSAGFAHRGRKLNHAASKLPTELTR
jgi:hypothetical protein